ncbi:MAG TPA: hypothetical protein VIL48_15950 [Acidimicrobiales bacterium]
MTEVTQDAEAVDAGGGAETPEPAEVTSSAPSAAHAAAAPSPPTSPATGSSSTSSVLAVGALASIGAGVVHATAVGSHNEHRQAMYAFAVLALFQIGWGALAFVRSHRLVALLGAAGNAVALGGWVLARTSGIGFVDGLEESEPVQFADGLAAALAAVAIVAALASLVGRFDWARRPQPVLLGVTLLATVGLVVPGMVAAAGHGHGGGGHGHGEGGHGDHQAAVVPPRPYDGTLPVDLSGVPGVSPEEQAEAEELVTRTIQRLPQFADTETAYERGYRSIGDAGTGVEHYVNWRMIDDEYILDPDHPESLVYRVDGPQERTLVAAMFILRSTDTLETTPDVGGELIQWHIHNNLCYTGEPFAWRVAAVADPPAECPGDTFRLSRNNAPMVHVWITAHPCGPFAALEGVGGGQIPEGEERLCDHAHGDPNADVGEGPFGGGGEAETARGS